MTCDDSCTRGPAAEVVPCPREALAGTAVADRLPDAPKLVADE